MYQSIDVTNYQKPSKGIIFEKPSRTQQHFANETNIKKIVERYQRTGVLGNPMAPRTARPMFGDFRGVDFLTAQNTVIEASHRFAALPSNIRERFENDPANLLAFLELDSNREEAISLGLIEKPEEKPVPPVPAPPA